MKIFSNKSKLINALKKENNLGFVPTMGALHKAHIYLIKKSFLKCNKTIVSIFVNKPQFDKKKDYINYPRNLKKDILLLKKHKVDFLYLPSIKQIYPRGVNKKIKISNFSKKLCGKNRPGHFEAIIDVLDRFIKIIRPNKLFLGKKDYQQLKIVENFLMENKINTKVIKCNTIREKNGLACSSRNFLLSNEEKLKASQIYKLIYKNKTKLISNFKNLKDMKKKILSLGVRKIDYLQVLDINKQTKPLKKNKKNKIFIAYYLRSVRLIDNI